MSGPFFPQLVNVGDYLDSVYLNGVITSFGGAGTGYTGGDLLTCTEAFVGRPLIGSVVAVDGSGGITSGLATGSGGSQYGGYRPKPPPPIHFSGGTGTGFTGAWDLTYPHAVMVPYGTLGGGLPGSFSQMTASYWICLGRSAQGPAFENVGQILASGGAVPSGTFAISTTQLGIPPSPPTSGPISVSVFVGIPSDTMSASAYRFQGQFSGDVPCYNVTDLSGSTLTDYILNTIISFDTVAQTISVCVNDTLLTLDIIEGLPGWESSGSVVNSSGAIWGVSNGFLGDVWIDNTYRDLSVAATRHQWINADLTAVNLPSNGQISSGADPVVFLHALASGAPNDFIANSGSGGSWGNLSVIANEGGGTISGLFTDLEFVGIGACQTLTPPIPTPNPPTGSCGASTQNSVTFDWTPDPDFGTPDSYTLQYRQVGSGTWTTITGLTVTTFTVSPVLPGTAWEWHVEAIYSGVETGFSDLVVCSTPSTPSVPNCFESPFQLQFVQSVTPPPPPAPTPPVGSLGVSTKSSVTFNWTPDPDFGAPDSYTLQYRIVGTVAWTTITDIVGTTYTLSPVPPGTNWEWHVQAIYGDATTGFSDLVSGFAVDCLEFPYPFQFLNCEGYTIAPPLLVLYGFDHLLGMAVTGLIDGIVFNTRVNCDGSVTFPFPVSDVKIGLGFHVQLQTPDLDAGAPTVQGRRKNVSAVTVRVEASNGIQIGTNQPDGAALTPPAIAPHWGATTPMTDDPAWSVQKQTYLSPAGQTVTKLVTGDIRVPVTSDWRVPGQIAMQQLQPLPMNILACIPELLEGDITEQGYSGEERPRQRADERRQQQGPGSWMLRR